MSNLFFVRYSSVIATACRAGYRHTATKAHVTGAFAPPKNGHRVATTLCGRRYSDMEAFTGNGVIEPFSTQRVTCANCARGVISCN